MGRQKPTHKDASAITREPLNPYVIRCMSSFCLSNVTKRHLFLRHHAFLWYKSQSSMTPDPCASRSWVWLRQTRLPRSRLLFSRLSILPENISTFEAQTCRGCREKRWTRICGQTHTRTHTHTHTHTQTHRPSTITLARACAARVNY